MLVIGLVIAYKTYLYGVPQNNQKGHCLTRVLIGGRFPTPVEIPVLPVER